MSEKYLIDKASLTALADITRAYNETPNKEYSLVEVTEQVKKASENFHNLFGEGITELRNDSMTALLRQTFSAVSRKTEPYMDVIFPNVTSIEYQAMRGNSVNKIYLPKFSDSGTGIFNQCVFYRCLYLPSLTWAKGTDFNNCQFHDSIYLPNLEQIDGRSFSSLKMDSERGFFIFKSVPTLSSNFVTSTARGLKIFIPSSIEEEFSNATNWSNAVNQAAELRVTATYEDDYEDVWKMLVEDGHLTEEEIRRDFYAES
jgi:hypothetical protein